MNARVSNQEQTISRAYDQRKRYAEVFDIARPRSPVKANPSW